MKLVVDAVIDYIKDNYDFKDGCFYHAFNKRGCKMGDRAGFVTDSRGYRRINVLDSQQYEHRMSFLMHYGWLPDEVDHINRDKGDNRPCNLRAVSRTTNNYNKGLQSNNTSGTIGVSWHKQRKKWAVRLCDNGKYRSFGLYEDKQEAVDVATAERDRIMKEHLNG